VITEQRDIIVLLKNKNAFKARMKIKMTNPTQMEMMMWDDHNRNRAEKMGHTCPMHPTILKPRFDRCYNPNNDKLKPFIPEPLPPYKPAPLINTCNRFDDDDYDDGYKPFIPEPVPLINTYNRFDDDDDGYNPFKKY